MFVSQALLRLRAVRPADPATAAATSNSLLLSTTGIDPGFAMSSPRFEFALFLKV